MIGPRARHLFEEIVVTERFYKANFQIGLRKCERQTQADRPGADDDNAIGVIGQGYAFGCTSLVAPAQP